MTRKIKWKLEASDDWNYGEPMYFDTFKKAKSRASCIDFDTKLKRYRSGDYADIKRGIFIKKIK